MDDTKEQIIEAISPTEYYQELFPDWSGEEEDKVTCPMSEDHKDSDRTPSLSLSPDSGAFYCFGCGFKGTSVVGYHADVICGGGSRGFRKAIALLYRKHVRGTIPVSDVKQYIRNLKRRPKLRSKITTTRGWTTQTMQKLRLGWDHQRKRVCIPIFNREGLCIDLKFHDSLRRARRINGKRVPMLGMRSDEGGTTGDWFPLSSKHDPFAGNPIWLVEGEPDAILGLQDGLNTLTVTGGTGGWAKVSSRRLRWLEGRDVIVCFDKDPSGKKRCKALLEELTNISIRSAKAVSIPRGNDISEFFIRHHGSAEQLKQIASLTPYAIAPKNRVSKVVALAETSRADLVGQSVVTEVLVNGKSQSPISVPNEMRVSCNAENRCPMCPSAEEPFTTHTVLRDDPDILEWAFARDYRGQIKKDMGIPNRCPVQVEIVSYQNMEPVSMIPALGIKESGNKDAFVNRRGYFLGHGLESNQSYSVNATPAVHPKTKESVLLIEKAKGSYDSINNFKLTDEELTKIQKVFCDPPKKTIKDIAEMLSRNHTRIWGRWDLHVGVDLVFHSPIQFSFANTVVPKGSMELIVIGDTRCGKGQVCEGIAAFYDLGVVVSGENSSFMGLVGGARTTDRGFELSWGRIPTNHGRLVIIDEFSGYKDMGKLSRIRSEGVAEIDKAGFHSSARANTRLIWIANPKAGAEIGEFKGGIEALQKLVGTNEDIARFDLAISVAKGEVDVATINKLNGTTLQSKYSRGLLRTVCLWAWSRRPEHILFDRGATKFILRHAQSLAERYSGTIPLIQGENVRFKIAKLAAAIACRCFSTEDGEFVNVQRSHAEAAVSLIKYLYDKPVMGYKEWSDIERGTSTLVETDKLDDFFKKWKPEIRMGLIDGLLEVDKFSVREIMDWLNIDATIAKKFSGLFVRCHAVKQVHGMYVKKPAFIKYLQRMKK